MKGKRYTTEDKIRILREADRGRSVLEVCREHNVSEVSFHRWKRQFGQMDLNEARKLKELERENGELKKMQSRSPAQEPGARSRRWKKMVSPAHRRQAAHAVVKRGLCSGRAACRILRLPRATFWYKGHPPTPTQQRLAGRLRALSEAHPRYGYRRIAALLRQEGWSVGKRHVQRLRRADGLRVPPTKRRLVRRGLSTGLPTKASHRGHVWTWDFISDATVRGGTLKMLTVLDEHTRECHVLRPERALRAADVLAWLERAIHEHGAPAFLRSDNGPEFIAKEVQRWLADNQIKTIYIDPGSPWQNGFVESFHGRFRDECLNREQLWTLTEARVVVADYQQNYNHSRPHSKLGYISPARFAARNPRPTSYMETGQNN